MGRLNPGIRAAATAGMILWASSAQGQSPPPQATAPATAPATATATATPTPTATPPSPSPFPPSNGLTATLLPPTFGNPHPIDVPGSTARSWGVVTIVFGVVFTGFGIASTAVAKSKFNESNAAGYCVEGVCTHAGEDLRNTAQSLADAATWLFVAAAACVGGGIALYVTAPSASGQPKVGLAAAPGGLVLKGAW